VVVAGGYLCHGIKYTNLLGNVDMSLSNDCFQHDVETTDIDTIVSKAVVETRKYVECRLSDCRY